MVMDPDACADGYPDSEALASDPVGFVQDLYAAAHHCLTEVVAELQSGELSARSRAIEKTESIVRRLMESLDHELHAHLARDMEGLYEYMLDRFAEAHLGPSREPLMEVKKLLSALTEHCSFPEPLAEPIEPDLPAYLQEESSQDFIDYDPEPSIEYVEWPKVR